MPLRETATAIVERLRSAGFDAYFVGGCVRDMLLGIEPHDYDIASSAKPADIKALFPRVIEVGAQFGVTKVEAGGEWFEVAAFRSDIGYSDGRRPDAVEFTDARGDVMRRDFTINGLLYNPIDNRVIDYVGGQDDIARKIVRCIGEPARRFDEDKLRLLRSVRFAARLDYEIEAATFSAVRANAAEIRQVSAERIGIEILNIITGTHPDRGLQLLLETGLLQHVLPEINAMVGIEQPPEFHPEGDVFEHTKLMLSHLRSPSVELALAVLLQDVGKPPTFRVAERIRFDEHASVGADIAGQICRRLRLPNSVTENVIMLIATHMKFMDIQRMKESRLIRFLREPYFLDALELHRIDCLASHGNLDNYDFCKQKLETLEPERVRPPRLLTGNDLIEMAYVPGPSFTEILRATEDAQLEGLISTREEAFDFVHRNFPNPARTGDET